MSHIDLNQLAAAGKNLSASSAAWLLAYFPLESQWHDEARRYLQTAVDGACQAAKTAVTPATEKKKDPNAEKRLQSFSADRKIKLFTDYEEALKLINIPDRVEMVSNEEESDFTLMAKHIKSFLTIPHHRRVNQFPYEGGLVRKDLLPLTVRRYCYTNGVAPKWWLPCFDLSTEFHLFYEAFTANAAAKTDNRWIIKPSQGTRGIGHQIVSDGSISGLQTAASMAPIYQDSLLLAIAADPSNLSDNTKSYDGADRVAQLLVDQPLLVQGRKFDIRCFVFVRSFEPFEAYMHHLYYARLANKPYQIDQLSDPKVAITVCAYDEDEQIAAMQERLLNVDLKQELEQQHIGIDYDGMVELTYDMLCDLFGGAAPSIGEWPQSSAYYSIDVIFDNNHQNMTCSSVFTKTAATSGSEEGAKVNHPFTPQPKLLEVNFMGDWHGVEAAVHQHSDYEQWVSDLVTVLATKDDVNEHPRLRRLRDPRDTTLKQK